MIPFELSTRSTAFGLHFEETTLFVRFKQKKGREMRCKTMKQMSSVSSACFIRFRKTHSRHQIWTSLRLLDLETCSDSNRANTQIDWFDSFATIKKYIDRCYTFISWHATQVLTQYTQRAKQDDKKIEETICVGNDFGVLLFSHIAMLNELTTNANELFKINPKLSNLCNKH